MYNLERSQICHSVVLMSVKTVTVTSNKIFWIFFGLKLTGTKGAFFSTQILMSTDLKLFLHLFILLLKIRKWLCTDGVHLHYSTFSSSVPSSVFSLSWVLKNYVLKEKSHHILFAVIFFLKYQTHIGALFCAQPCSTIFSHSSERNVTLQDMRSSALDPSWMSRFPAYYWRRERVCGWKGFIYK